MAHVDGYKMWQIYLFACCWLVVGRKLALKIENPETECGTIWNYQKLQWTRTIFMFICILYNNNNIINIYIIQLEGKIHSWVYQDHLQLTTHNYSNFSSFKIAKPCSWTWRALCRFRLGNSSCHWPNRNPWQVLMDKEAFQVGKVTHETQDELEEGTQTLRGLGFYISQDGK